MVAISLSIDPRQIAQLKRELGDLADKKLPRELEIAVNATAKDVERELAGRKEGIRSELKVTTGDAKKAIDRTRATKGRPVATVIVRKEKRFPLRAFRPRQLKKGVSYKTSPKGGTKRIRDAFIPRPGGHVLKRHGPERYPLATIVAASPWGAVAKRGIKPRMIRFGKAQLYKNVKKRIDFRIKKRTGVI